MNDDHDFNKDCNEILYKDKSIEFKFKKIDYDKINKSIIRNYIQIPQNWNNYNDKQENIL